VVIVAEKTEARKKAEIMEEDRLKPMSSRERRLAGAVVGPRMMQAPAEMYDAARSVVSPRKPRTEEEVSELTREISKGGGRKGVDPTLPEDVRKALVGAGYAKGGKVSASSRADGCCKRGKTRGKMV
jgi:hypothetical protein